MAWKLSGVRKKASRANVTGDRMEALICTSISCALRVPQSMSIPVTTDRGAGSGERSVI